MIEDQLVNKINDVRKYLLSNVPDLFDLVSTVSIRPFPHGYETNLIALAKDEEILVNPIFLKLEYGFQIFILLHELYHVLFGHSAMAAKESSKNQSFSFSAFNIACDAIINTHILDVHKDIIPNFSQLKKERLEKVWTIDNFRYRIHDAYVSANRIKESPIDLSRKFSFSLRDIYNLIIQARFDLKDTLKMSVGGRALNASLSSVNDIEDMRGKYTGYELNKRLVIKSKLQSQYLNNAEKTGINTNIIRSFQDYDSKVNWRKVLHGFLCTICEATYETDYSRPDRQYLALRDEYGVSLDFDSKPKMNTKNLVIGIDTSGSVSEVLLNRFVNEVIYIKDMFNIEITVIECNDQINKIHNSLENFKNQRLQSGGGTSYQPVFNHVEKIMMYKNLNICGILYFTDLGAKPPIHNLTIPVAWVVPGYLPVYQNGYGNIIKLTE